MDECQQNSFQTLDALAFDGVEDIKMFNLENEIRNWLRTLRRSSDLEDSDIAELESHLRDEIDSQIKRGLIEEEAFLAAQEKSAPSDSLRHEYEKARLYERTRPFWHPSRFMPALIWSHLKIAVRKIKRQRSFSFINIAGLAIGMACFILIVLWIQNELSYDKFHTNKDRLYRIQNKLSNGSYSNSLSYALPPALKEEYPEVEEMARVWPWHRSLVKYQDKSFDEENFYLTDPGFFNMFSFPFIHGNPETALQDKYSVVLTQETAQRYFGNENPVGKVLYLAAQNADFRVTGVIENTPANSHLQFDMISRVEWLGEDRLARWREWVAPAYVLLHSGAAADTVNTKIADIYKEHISPDNDVEPVLQPLTRVHLYENGRSGAIVSVYIFSIIAFFILIMACINFMNLSTARSSLRSREVGVRKVLGATRAQVARQFLGEAVLISFLAMLLSLVCVWATLPAFNNFTAQELSLFSGNNVWIFLILFLTVLFTGIVAGSYPALFLSSFQPVKTLKNRMDKNSGGLVFRRVLIIFQFTVSIGLILCTLLVSKQLRYVQNKDLGLNREYVVTLNNNPDLGKRFDVFKQELKNKPGILNVTSAAQRPMQVGQGIPVNWEGNPNEVPALWAYTMADYDFFETFDMEILLGRSFSKEFPTDEKGGCIINETAAKMLGLENPIGTNIFFGHMALDPSLRNLHVIGVVKDFHYRSLYNSIGPFLFRIYKPYHFYVFIKIDANQITEALQIIKTVFEKYAPDYPFRYEFLDEAFNRQYVSDLELRRIFNLFSVLSIIVACLGLFGLASFTAEQKTKEIGIRKILGAPFSKIVSLTANEFLKWIIVANLIAWPVGYLLIKQWLNTFVYKVSIGLDMFLMASGIALLVVFVTVSYQTVKAALANPVDSLRHE
jgi:putative ABC transport system permease protein